MDLTCGFLALIIGSTFWYRRPVLLPFPVQMSKLQSILSLVLPTSLSFKVYHIATNWEPSDSLFSSPPASSSSQDESTQCAKHLLTVAVPQGEKETDEVIIFAIEVFVYNTTSLTTIFVSKADSTGFLNRVNAPSGTPSIVRSVTTAFLQYLIDLEPKDKRIVLSLFARSQNQYLFPGSIENSAKHVLDDRQLVKWWCRTVDPILREYKVQEDREARDASDEVTSAAYVVVPGCDRYETRNFFPPSFRADSATQPRWHATHPLYLIRGVDDPKSGLPPRCLVPRFPDDPKSRFLDDLDDEIRLPDSEEVGNEGRWRSVKSLEQFWEMMSYRQECSAGRLVGFIWVVINPPKADKGITQSTIGADDFNPSTGGNPDAPPLPTPAQSQQIQQPESTATTTDNLFEGNPSSDLDPLPDQKPVSPAASPPTSAAKQE